MRTYVKPDLCYESFELSTHIATCALDMPSATDDKSCYATGADIGIPEDLKFFNNAAVCTDGPLDIYCYTNGSLDVNIFNS